jgi:hypothetical protein
VQLYFSFSVILTMYVHIMSYNINMIKGDTASRPNLLVKYILFILCYIHLFITIILLLLKNKYKIAFSLLCCPTTS